MADEATHLLSLHELQTGLVQLREQLEQLEYRHTALRDEHDRLWRLQARMNRTTNLMVGTIDSKLESLNDLLGKMIRWHKTGTSLNGGQPPE